MELLKSLERARETLTSVHPGDLHRWDAEQRQEWRGVSSWSETVTRALPSTVHALATLSGDRETTGILFAAHPSGWVREAALSLLRRQTSPLAVAMLVLRSGDWVLPVRTAAQNILRDLVARESERVLTPALSLLEQLADHEARAAAFAQEMLAKAIGALDEATLVESLRRPDRRVRRAAARVLARRGAALRALGEVERQDDAVATEIVAHAILDAGADGPSLRRLLAARPPSVRARALHVLLATPEAAAEGLAARMLMDVSANVRVVAHRYLSHDVAAEHYLDVLLDPTASRRPLCTALRGLAELGGEEHAAAIASFASHPSARVRAIVCAVIGAAHRAELRDVLFRLLQDETERVSTRAGRALARAGLSAAEVDHLWSQTTASPSRSLMCALRALDRWHQLVYALRVFAPAIPRRRHWPWTCSITSSLVSGTAPSRRRRRRSARRSKRAYPSRAAS
jgi:HEAT repeat protein